MKEILSIIAIVFFIPSCNYFSNEFRLFIQNKSEISIGSKEVYISIISCHTQNLSIELDGEQKKVLNIFLQNQKRGFLDKHYFKKNLIKKFKADYLRSTKLYNVADSICSESSDSKKLKFYCPIADSFKIYDSLLTNNDLNFLIGKYDRNEERNVFNIDVLIKGTNILKHSDEYYRKIDYDRYDGVPDLNEFPSIRINNIYFNENHNIAIISYSLVSEQINSITSGFYLMEKKDNISWKPIGNLKI